MIGIDWVSAAILLVGYGLSNFGTSSLKFRNLAMAVACLAVAGYRFSLGAQGLNLAMVGLAAVFGVMYLVRAFR